MARIPMVTRSIDSTEVTFMVVNVETGLTETRALNVTGAFKNEEQLLYKLKALQETEKEKVVCILDKHAVEALYGMTEEDFIRYGKVLPPRKKANEANSEE